MDRLLHFFRNDNVLVSVIARNKVSKQSLTYVKLWWIRDRLLHFVRNDNEVCFSHCEKQNFEAIPDIWKVVMNYGQIASLRPQWQCACFCHCEKQSFEAIFHRISDWWIMNSECWIKKEDRILFAIQKCRDRACPVRIFLIIPKKLL